MFKTDDKGREYYHKLVQSNNRACFVDYYPDIDGFYWINGNKLFKCEATGLMSRG